MLEMVSSARSLAWSIPSNFKSEVSHIFIFSYSFDINTKYTTPCMWTRSSLLNSLILLPIQSSMRLSQSVCCMAHVVLSTLTLYAWLMVSAASTIPRIFVRRLALDMMVIQSMPGQTMVALSQTPEAILSIIVMSFHTAHFSLHVMVATSMLRFAPP